MGCAASVLECVDHLESADPEKVRAEARRLLEAFRCLIEEPLALKATSDLELHEVLQVADQVRCALSTRCGANMLADVSKHAPELFPAIDRARKDAAKAMDKQYAVAALKLGDAEALSRVAPEDLEVAAVALSGENPLFQIYLDETQETRDALDALSTAG